MEPTVTIDISKWANEVWLRTNDVVVREEIITVFLNGSELVQLHCSPECLDELVVGYLKLAQLINDRHDLRTVTVDQDQDAVHVYTRPSPVPNTAGDLAEKASGLSPEAEPNPNQRELAGAESRPITSSFRLKPEQVLKLIRQLHKSSALFRLTGGVHSAGLGTVQDLILFRQDIGRHNAVDKVIGHMIIQAVAPDDKALLLSGRISAEIIAKAATVGIPLLISPAAPTHLAVDLARRRGITVVGFVRNHRLSVYSEAWRLQDY